ARTKGKVERFNGYLKSSFVTPLAAVARRVKMSHEVQSKSEPLFRKVRPFCAKAHHASEGSVDDHPCAHCSRPVAARDRPATWHFTQHGGPLRGQRRCAALQAARTSTD